MSTTEFDSTITDTGKRVFTEREVFKEIERDKNRPTGHQRTWVNLKTRNIVAFGSNF